MKTKLSPIAAVLGILAAVLVIGVFMYMRSEGKTFTKSEVSSDDRMGGKVDLDKLSQEAAKTGAASQGNQGGGTGSAK